MCAHEWPRSWRASVCLSLSIVLLLSIPRTHDVPTVAMLCRPRERTRNTSSPRMSLAVGKVTRTRWQVSDPGPHLFPLESPAAPLDALTEGIRLSLLLSVIESPNSIPRSGYLYALMIPSLAAHVRRRRHSLRCHVHVDTSVHTRSAFACARWSLAINQIPVR